MSKTEVKKIDHNLTCAIGAQVMAAQLANIDPAVVDDAHLNLMADVAVRAALALDAAIPRAEERLAAEAKAAADAAAAQEAVEKAAVKDSKPAATK